MISAALVLATSTGPEGQSSTLPSPLLAVAFVNPALLGGLALLAVPVIIHLLSRRRFRHIQWGATRFLLEAEKENRRRVRFEQWLLVALRALALALLALLVARPFVRPGLAAALLGGRGQVHRVIAIDDSASLAYRVGNTQDFAALRDAGQRLLGWLHGGAAGDPVTVYLTSQPTEPLVAGERLTGATLADLQARIERLEPVNLPARPRRTMQAAVEVLQAEDRPGGRSPTRAHVYVLSDFQRSEWLAVDSAGGSAFEPLGQLDPDAVRVALIATGTAARDNIAVLDVQLERPQMVAGLPVVVNATVANYSRTPLENARVQLDVDGAPFPPALVKTLGPGQSQTVSLEVTFPDEGFTELAVGVDAIDGFPADSRRRLVLPIKPSLRALLVNGQPATDPVRDEVYFLRTALAPTGPFSSGIRAQTIDPSEIEATALDTFDCVLLCNVAAPGQGAVAALERYVRSGGGLVFFLGPEVGEPDEYNRAFYAGGEGLLPLPLVALQGDRGTGASVPREERNAQPGVGLVRTGDHPVTAMFPAGGATLSEYVRFRRYYRCAEPAPVLPGDSSADDDLERVAASQPREARPPATVLARFTDAAQTPALVERAFGRGRVLLFTSTVDLDWNDWARAMDGSYVVTLLELAQYAARRGADPLSFVAGETLTVSLSPDEYEAGAAFRSPAFPEEPAVQGRAREPVAVAGQPVVLEGPVAVRLGTYTAELVRRDGRVELRPLAVSLDATESDLSVARAHELDTALGNVPHEYLTAGEAFLRDDEQARRELWPTVLLILVAILLSEQGLAWWFGRPDRGVRRARRLSPRLGRFTIVAR